MGDARKDEKPSKPGNSKDYVDRLDCFFKCLSFALVIFMSVIIYYSINGFPVSKRYDERHRECTDSVYKHSCYIDSLQLVPCNFESKNTTEVKDSLLRCISDGKKAIQIIHRENEHISNRMDDVISDLRQETNNNICELNLWIAFAVFLLSIMGVIIPVCLQFKLAKDSREERNELIEHTNRCEKVLYDLNIEKEQRSIEFDQIKNEYNKRMAELTRNINLFHLMTTLISGLDEKVWSEFSGREGMLQSIWKEFQEQFSEYIEWLYQQKEAERYPNLNGVDKSMRIRYLIDILIQLNTFIKKLNITSGGRRIRELDKTKDLLKTILQDLNEVHSIYVSDIKDKIFTLRNQVSLFAITNLRS